jgi:hypothetical protein
MVQPILSPKPVHPPRLGELITIRSSLKSSIRNAKFLASDLGWQPLNLACRPDNLASRQCSRDSRHASIASRQHVIVWLQQDVAGKRLTVGWRQTRVVSRLRVNASQPKFRVGRRFDNVWR